MRLLTTYDHNGRPAQALMTCGLIALVQYGDGSRAVVPTDSLHFGALHSLYLRRNRLRDDPGLAAWAKSMLAGNR